MEEEKIDISSVIEDAKTLDAKAIARVFEHYYSKIYRYIYYRVETKEDAKDLTSEVFVRLVREIKYQTGNFDAWIYHIARNLLIDYYRRKTIRKESHIDEKTIEAIPYESKNNPLLSEEELRKALEMLTEEQKEVIILKFIEGYDNQKISQITGKSIGAIKALQFRALVTLRDFFKKD